jgi:hypothetical protein
LAGGSPGNERLRIADKEATMYIGLGTLVLIIILVLLLT